VKNIRAAAVISAFTLATGLATVTTAAALPAAVDATLAPISAPLVSQDAAGYQGKWAIEGATVVESFEKDGIVISAGSTSLREGLTANSIVSFGFVGGFGDPTTGENYAQLSGQAGAGVTAVRIISASGVETAADLVDGVWGAVWVAGDHADEYGAATIEFDTAEGTTTVSTDAVDVIAADQRAAEQD
jgi:hypothetical protein